MSTEELARIYSAEWFAHDFKDLRGEFNLAANAVYRQFVPGSVADVGCGPGMMLERLDALGCDVTGFEGSIHGIEYASLRAKSLIEHVDICSLSELASFELVICTEVLEHIPEEYAPRVVSLLCSAMAPMVITAAPPGQDGHHHVNCQPKDYWRALFAQHGVIEDLRATEELQRRWSGLTRLSHMRANVTVLR